MQMQVSSFLAIQGDLRCACVCVLQVGLASPKPSFALMTPFQPLPTSSTVPCKTLPLPTPCPLLRLLTTSSCVSLSNCFSTSSINTGLGSMPGGRGQGGWVWGWRQEGLAQVWVGIRHQGISV